MVPPRWQKRNNAALTIILRMVQKRGGERKQCAASLMDVPSVPMEPPLREEYEIVQCSPVWNGNKQSQSRRRFVQDIDASQS